MPGAQTIARAEALAALQALRLAFHAGCLPVQIVTDSVYVVRILTALQAGLSRSSVDFPANADILGLFREVWFRDVSVVKVKSHVCPHSIADAAARWNALGNASADQACKQALGRDLSLVHELVQDVAQTQDEQRVQLEAVYRYLLSLNRATGARLTQPQNADPTTAADPLDQQQLQGAASCLSGATAAWIRSRTTEQAPVVLPVPLRKVFLQSSWGPRFSWAVWAWAQTLVWTDKPSSAATGVTTLELFCDFITTTALLPPVVVNSPAQTDVGTLSLIVLLLACIPHRCGLGFRSLPVQCDN